MTDKLEEPPIDLDFTPLGDLDGDELVDHHEEVGKVVREGPFIEHDDWRERINERYVLAWLEIRRRAETQEPKCPHCGHRQWGVEAGELPVCQECHEYSPPEMESDIHDAWKAIRSEVSGNYERR